jgi:hypothetical protein
VHGNLPALEAVLAELEREQLDSVIVCGDVASGPLPAETIDLLMALPLTLFVRGNADRGLVAAYDRLPLPEWPGPDAEWCAGRISRSQRDFLASFAETVRLRHRWAWTGLVLSRLATERRRDHQRADATRAPPRDDPVR